VKRWIEAACARGSAQNTTIMMKNSAEDSFAKITGSELSTESAEAGFKPSETRI
jgi:hypothetical protein